MIVFNPDNGARINGWKHEGRFYTLEIGESYEFSDDVAMALCKTYGFLVQIDPETIEKECEQLEEELEVMKKTDMTFADDKTITKARKLKIKKEKAEYKKELLPKLDPMENEGEGENEIKLEDLKRGELYSMCLKAGYEPKMIRNKRKDTLIQFLKNKENNLKK